MKAFWKQYGLWIEILLIVVWLALAVSYGFWKEDNEKLFLRWAGFFLFLYLLADRIIRLYKRSYKKAE